METLNFKSNIKCTGCLKKVTLPLRTIKGIVNWDVSLKHPNRILTVMGVNVTAGQIEKAVRKAGYNVEQIK